MSDPAINGLADLNRLRSAPPLSAIERKNLKTELIAEMSHFAWFTVGVMASSSIEAMTCLRDLELAMGWPSMQLADETRIDSGVFLKANQSNGCIRIRAEEGLGQGFLLSGHQVESQHSGPTWGPLPLDLFRD
ncbi:hypothetical protein WB44_06290 [Synechococcus sp. WH 8020]|uniref:DUF1824 family protein n=1 Tax=Synechococcus sp. (strain WH8020) TaxID=32052 RepID=UPI0006527897|nr:DUF1824 family protein [Synechococcus sp. WH 8020]AKN60767.1 hypothetical protein WB44_06290 [Synechococcus sp. WH 8020]